MMRRMLFAALLGMVLAASWVIVRIGIADALAEAQPEAALAWWPSHRAALLSTATAAAEAPQRSLEAIAVARQVLARAPLSGTAFRVIARSAEIEGDVPTALANYRIAAHRAPRDRATHAWLVNHAASRGDFETALFHIDQLLRIAPGLRTELQPVLGSMISLAEARTPLLRLMGETGPPWRSPFLQWWSQQPEAAPTLAAIFAPLRSAPHPLTEQERRFWIDRLLREGRVGQAHFLWIEALPETRRKTVGNVVDGGFELPPDNAGFGWYFNPIAGATIHQESTPGVGGSQALVLDFHDRRVAFAHVQQRLALPSGHYLLQGRTRLDGLRNERGLHWQLRCDGGRVIAESERFQGNSRWRDFEVGFERPSESCSGQILLLRLDARIAPEQMIGGRIWFDDLRITRVTH